jgi:hypothetical protein
MTATTQYNWELWSDKLNALIETLSEDVATQVVNWSQNANGYELEDDEYLEMSYSSIVSSIGEQSLEDVDGFREVYNLSPKA